MTQLGEPALPHFLEMTLDEWVTWARAQGESAFRGRQVAEWIFSKQQWDPAAMSNLSKVLRHKLIASFDWSLPEIHHRVDSADGSSKLVLRSPKSQAIETVIMRYENRTALCVSSQVGCKLACDFCQTGKMGFVSHLGVASILGQFAAAQKVLATEGAGRRISHVVFMGMGEPLDNYDNTVAAANQLISPEGFGLSKKNVTISTSGLVPQIKRLAGDSAAAFALSLHAARDELRSTLMPINRKYPLAALKEALLAYQNATDRLITIEYIMIRDMNCGRREVKELVKFIHGLRVKVNLIPFNEHPGMPYQRPDDQVIREFQAYLAERSIPAPVRYSKGLDVSAACGQLAAKQHNSLDQIPKRRDLLLEQ